jgi:hypothetical protein
MALQSSGQISINDIRTELGTTSGDLRVLSSTAGFSTPDQFNDFYGYSAVTWFSTEISETGFEDPGQACAEGPDFGTVRVFYTQAGFNDLRTSEDGETFNGNNLWYYARDFVGSYIIDSRGGVGEFADCKG